MSYSVESRVSVSILCNSSAWQICLFSAIYLLIGSLVYININSQVCFIFYVIVQHCLFFFSQIVPALSIGYPFSSTHVPFHYCGFYPFLSSFLPFFLSPDLELVISPRRPGSFHWIMVLETRPWPLVPGRLTIWGDIRVYTDLCVSTCLFICHVCLLMSTLAVYACPSVCLSCPSCLSVSSLSFYPCLSIHLHTLSLLCIHLPSPSVSVSS